MKLFCKSCGRTQTRDARTKTFKMFWTKKGYKSWCEKSGKYTYLRPQQHIQ